MSIIQPTRRGLIGGLASFVLAPAIVRVENLMPLSFERYVQRLPARLSKEIFMVNGDTLHLTIERIAFGEPRVINFDCLGAGMVSRDGSVTARLVRSRWQGQPHPTERA